MHNGYADISVVAIQFDTRCKTVGVHMNERYNPLLDWTSRIHSLS